MHLFQLRTNCYCRLVISIGVDQMTALLFVYYWQIQQPKHRGWPIRGAVIR